MKDSEQYETPENSRRRGASSDHLYFLPVPLRIDREPVIPMTAYAGRIQRGTGPRETSI